MRLYVDEDLASKELIARLSAAGHEVVPTQRGSTDADAWALAQAQAAAVVTANVRDFVSLADAGPLHHGLLLVYREADATRNLTFAEIAAAVAVVEEAVGPDVAGQVLVLNRYRSQ